MPTLRDDAGVFFLIVAPNFERASRWAADRGMWLHGWKWLSTLESCLQERPDENTKLVILDWPTDATERKSMRAYLMTRRFDLGEAHKLAEAEFTAPHPRRDNGTWEALMEEWNQ